jgi:hypothetical protein
MNFVGTYPPGSYKIRIKVIQGCYYGLNGFTFSVYPPLYQASVSNVTTFFSKEILDPTQWTLTSDRRIILPNSCTYALPPCVGYLRLVDYTITNIALCPVLITTVPTIKLQTRILKGGESMELSKE